MARLRVGVATMIVTLYCGAFLRATLEKGFAIPQGMGALALLAATYLIGPSVIESVFGRKSNGA